MFTVRFILESLKVRASEWRRAESGSISVEAVLMFPILLWGYIGMYVFFEGLRENNINLKAAYTIGDLLSADVDATAVALNVRYIKAGTLTDWQDQTRLMVDAPGLRVLDSQILVGAGIRSVDELSKASAKKVLNAATSFLDTPQGARVLWGGENSVDKQEVEGWIGLAKAARA